ncbi:MAG: 50S ribosomal protein L40e [Candidatus Hecatellaceae archaeon]|nr:MAG: 50S ribosomal protein L40e [Candidatus Hecatellales archaeon]RLI24935.1 MAG: 50S ribosomal protein L40e [Candidatus Hecatellales archaeon]
MPVTDYFKRTLAQKHKLYVKICRVCGVRNAPTAEKCRKCHSRNLRWKKRELGAKK